MRRLLLGILLILPLKAAGPKTYQFELADCDDIAFGPEGDLYFACHSPTDRLPVDVRGARPVADEMDGYVLRFSPRTERVVYATRLGGSAFDAALRVKVDKAGFVYVTGLTKSNDFLRTKPRGGSDAFLVKLSPDGETSYATRIGGSGDDVGNALDLDDEGNVYLGGTTSSSDFPAQKKPAGADAFLCRLSLKENDHSCVIFGGAKEEKVTGIALDGKKGLFATGYTSSADFPIRHPVQAALAGDSDLFLTRVALPGLEISFSTFFGGGGSDSGWGIAIDKDGNIVTSGITDSTDLPGTSDAYQRSAGGKKDAFLASFRGPEEWKVKATYFGGSDDDESGYDGGNIEVDRHGNVWLAGITYSDDLPVRNAQQLKIGGRNGDGFLAAFSPDLRQLCFSSYHGNRERNLLEGLAISESGVVAATGVSFAESPTAGKITIAPTIHAGASVLLLSVEAACSAPR